MELILTQLLGRYTYILLMSHVFCHVSTDTITTLLAGGARVQFGVVSHLKILGDANYTTQLGRPPVAPTYLFVSLLRLSATVRSWVGLAVGCNQSVGLLAG